MFTIQQIKDAHSKVKSGADFPAYIRDLKNLGVTQYEMYVVDGHTNYYGVNDSKITSSPAYDKLTIAATPAIGQFKAELKALQKGETNYTTFCKDAAKSDVEKWLVRLDDLTCTYLDKSGNKMLVEEIPQ